MTLTPTVLALAAAMATVQQDSTIADTVIRLDGLTVTATRSPAADRRDQPEALSVVRPSLSNRGAGTLAAHLLRDAAGVHVQQTSAGQGAVILRGLVGNQVLLLVDGIPLNNGTYRDGPGQYLATIDPETVERIEIIRGPASVLYGSDAQGGVVNIITHSHPLSGAAASVRMAGTASGADRGVRGRVSAGAMGGQWSVAAGATVVSTGDLRAGGGLGPQRPTGFEARGADAELTLHPGTRHTVRAVFQHFAMDDVPRFDRYVAFRNPDGGSDAEHLFDPQTRQLAYLRYTVTPRSPALSHLEATTSLGMQREGRSRIRLLDGGVPDSVRERWRDDVYTPGMSLVGTSMVPVGGRLIRLTWGGEFYHDRLSSQGLEQNLESASVAEITRVSATGEAIPSGNFPDDANADRLGLFVSAETRLVSWLRISLGGRWSRFRNAADVGMDFGGSVENTTADLTGQVGLVATPASRWRLAFRLAEGFRAPNLYDLTRVGPVPGGLAVPNPDARAEHSLSAELSVRFRARRGSYEVTVYHTTIDDFIDRAPGVFAGDTLFNGERVFQGLNAGTARVRGVEAEAGHAIGRVQAHTSVVYTYGKQVVAGGIEEPMSKIPPLGGHVGLRWVPGVRSLWIEYLLRWATAQRRLGGRDLRDPRIPPGGTPGYGVHGIRVGLSPARGLQVSLGFENLTDELYRTHASGVDGPGRHAWLGVSWLAGL